MRYPEQFNKKLGVLNVGIFWVTLTYVVFGFIGYLKYGEEVQGSLSLNLDVNTT
jgi:proton-coupled amino acid transporter